MSSSSGRYDNDNSSSSIHFKTTTTGIRSGTIPSSEVSSDSDNGNSDSEKERIGNTDWCVCGGKCRPMEMLPKVYVVVIQMKFQMNLNFLFKSSLFLQRTTSEKL